MYLISIALEVVREGKIESKPMLVQVTAGH